MSDTPLPRPKARHAHGLADWPDLPDSTSLPATLPDGKPWPTIQVIVVHRAADEAIGDAITSVAFQRYPSVELVVVATATGTALERALTQHERAVSRIAYPPAHLLERHVDDAIADGPAMLVVAIGGNDMLAPGALASLAMVHHLKPSTVISGLRITYDDTGVVDGDITAFREGALDRDRLAEVRGCEPAVAPVLEASAFERAAAARAGGFGNAVGARCSHALLTRLAAVGGTLAIAGRPIVLSRVDAADRPRPRPLSIAALNDIGYVYGAGIAHRRLVEALKLAGHDVWSYKLIDEAPAAEAETRVAFPRTEADMLSRPTDFVLAGNVHGSTRELQLFHRIVDQAPLGIVLHDLFSLTGRCIYPDTYPQLCMKYETGCDASCPTPHRYPYLQPDRIAAAHEGKQALFRRESPPLLLANSGWTAHMANVLGPKDRTAPIEQIRLAFPTQTFKPLDKAAARAALGLPVNHIVIAFAAVVADAPLKGLSELMLALKQLAAPNVTFVAIGRINEPGRYQLPGMIAAGSINDEGELAKWFSATDIYITASRMETFGQTPVEAALCGTPTIAYAFSGLKDSIINGVSGLHTPPTAEALHEGLKRLAADQGLREDLGRWGRLAMEARYSHVAAYQRLHQLFWDRGIVSVGDGTAAIRFTGEIGRMWAYSVDPDLSQSPTLDPVESGVVYNYLRRAKRAVLGEGQPAWMRNLQALMSRFGGRPRGPRA